MESALPYFVPVLETQSVPPTRGRAPIPLHVRWKKETLPAPSPPLSPFAFTRRGPSEFCSVEMLAFLSTRFMPLDKLTRSRPLKMGETRLLSPPLFCGQTISCPKTNEVDSRLLCHAEEGMRLSSPSFPSDVRNRTRSTLFLPSSD